MIYLDANVFIAASINQEEIGANARKILSQIQRGMLRAATSVLTIDEIMFVVQREWNKQHAINSCKALLASQIVLLDANKRISETALDLLEMLNLQPRDATHLATMKVMNLREVISEDQDFDKLSSVKRHGINLFAKQINN